MKCLLALVNFSTFAVFLAYSVIAPFFPPQLNARGLNELYNSVVFGIYAVTYVAGSILNSKVLIPRLGRSMAFLIGSVAQLLSIGLLIGIEYIHNNVIFIALAIVARLLQGGGSTIMVSLCYGLISLAQPKHLEVLHTILHIAITMGLAVSPFAGSFFYDLMGYLGPFLFVGVLSVPPLFLPCLISRYKFKNDSQQDQRPIYGTVLRNRRAVQTYCYLILVLTFYSSQEAVLSDFLYMRYRYQPSQVAFYFFYHFVTCMILSFAVVWLPPRTDIPMVFCASLLCASLATFLLAFSPKFEYAASKNVVISGLVVSGMSTLTPNYAVSQAINYTKPMVPKEDYGRLVNTASSLRTIGAGIAFFSGPIFGGLVAHYIGYIYLQFAFAVLYLGCGILEVIETIGRCKKGHFNKTQSMIEHDELNETDNEHRVLITEQAIHSRFFSDSK